MDGWGAEKGVSSSVRLSCVILIKATLKVTSSPSPEIGVPKLNSQQIGKVLNHHPSLLAASFVSLIRL